MADKTIYPFGVDGNLPSGYPIVNDLITGGADKALSAEMGKEIGASLYYTNIEQDILGSQLTSCGGSIRNSDNVWVSVSGYYGSLIDVSSYRGMSCEIIPNDTYGEFSYTFLKSGMSVNQVADFCDGYSLTTATHFDGKIPSDANYLYVYMVSTNNVYTPKEIIISSNGGGVKDKVDVISAEVDGVLQAIDGTNLTSCGGTISFAQNIWRRDLGYYGAIIKVSDYIGCYVKITRNINGNHVDYTFLTNGPSWGNAPSYASGYSRVVTSYNDMTISIPSDAVYLYVYMRSNTINYTPSSIIILNNSGVGVDVYELQQNNEYERSVIRCLAPKKLRVVTYNIGHFSGGANKDSTITSSNYNSKLPLYKETIAQLGADVFGLCEYSRIFGTNTNSQQVNASDVLFGSFIPTIIGEQRNYSCNAIFTKTVVENATSQQYVCNQSATITHTSAIAAKDYYYIESDLYVHGELVKLVMTHLAFDNNYPGVLQGDQIDELITKYANEERVILMGDWNVADFNEFNAFTSAGYTLANDGSFLTYNGTRALDNIIVKGLTVSNPGMITTTGQSDHYPFYCDVEL